MHCRQQTLVYSPPPCFVVWALAIVFIITNAVFSYDFNQNGNAMTYFGIIVDMRFHEWFFSLLHVNGQSKLNKHTVTLLLTHQKGTL